MSKYKFALNPKIRGFVEWQLEHYHEDKRQLAEYKAAMMPSVTPNYSLAPGGSGISNPTEQAAIRLTTNTYILSLERGIAAVDRVLAQLDDNDKALINLVYWQRSYTVVGAAAKIGWSKTQAYCRVNKILCAVALEEGLINV